MADCSFSLALCTENKRFSTMYYVLVGYKNLGLPLSDTGKSMVKKKPEGHPLIIKLLLSLWLLYKNYINYRTKQVSSPYADACPRGELNRHLLLVEMNVSARQNQIVTFSLSMYVIAKKKTAYIFSLWRWSSFEDVSLSQGEAQKGVIFFWRCIPQPGRPRQGRSSFGDVCRSQGGPERDDLHLEMYAPAREAQKGVIFFQRCVSQPGRTKQAYCNTLGYHADS